MIFNFFELLSEDFCLTHTRINLLLENLCALLKYLDLLGLSLVRNTVTLVLQNYALTADVHLTSITEVLCLLVGVLGAILFRCWLVKLKFYFLLMLVDILVRVEIVKNGEILNQLFDIGAEIAPASGTCQYITSPQIHKAMLTKGVPTS